VTVADALRHHLLAQQADERVVNALVHIDALDGRAELTAMRELRCDEFARGLLQIGVRLDDRGRLAAEFQRRLRDVRLAVVEHLAARVDTARQRNHADFRMRADGFGRCVIHRENIDHARRQRRALHGARQLERRQRRVVARTHDDRVARDQRWGDLAHQRIDREIERNQARDDADRLAMQHEILVRRIARNDFAFDTARPFRVIARDLRGVDGFVGRIEQALAGLCRERRADPG